MAGSLAVKEGRREGGKDHMGPTRMGSEAAAGPGEGERESDLEMR